MSTINLAEFRNRLVCLRKHLGLSRDKFAKSVGVSGAYIGQLESGKKGNPSDLFLESVSKTFNINLVWLKTGEGEMFRPAGEGEAKAAQDGYQHPNLKIQKIVEMLETMDENTQEDILLSVEKEKLLRDLLQEKRDKKAG